MNRKIVLLASLAAGVLAAFLTRVYISAKESEVMRREAAFKKKYGGEMTVLCLKRKLPHGSVIELDDLTNCVTFVKGNADTIPPERIREVVGRRTFGMHDAMVPLRWDYFENDGRHARSLAARIPARQGGLAYRAMSINVTGSTSVSGAIRPGDKVDVIGTFVFPNDEGKIHRGDPVTRTLLQNVDVLATGGDAMTARGRGLGDESWNQKRDEGYSLVTLAVTPREAEMLAYAEQIKGRLTLTLRRGDDLSTEDVMKPIHYDTIVEDIESLKKLRERARARSL